MRLFFMIILLAVLTGQSEAAPNCPPTKSDSLGPYYKPNAPVRSVLGTGYILQGAVRSSVDCDIIPKARIEVWHAGPDGEYADAYRATLIAGADGKYRLQSERPPSYSFWRPPHFHIRVEAPGYEILITQHYPEKSTSEATFDLVLVPANP